MQHIVVFYRTLIKYLRNIQNENVTIGDTVVRVEYNTQADSNDVTNKQALTSNKDKSI